MNTKTITSGAEIKRAPQQVPAKLDTDSKSKVAETSAKSATQAAVSAVVQPPKGNAMATETAETGKISQTYKEQLKALRDERKEVLDRIHEDSATDEDEKKLATLSKQIKNLTGEREKGLSGLKEQIRSLGLEPLDLFERDQVEGAYKDLNPKAGAAKKTPGSGKGSRPRTPVDETKLIIRKTGRGGGLKITKDDFLAKEFGSYTKVYLKNLADSAKDVDSFAEALAKDEAFVNDAATVMKSAKGKEALEALYKHSLEKSLPPKA